MLQALHHLRGPPLDSFQEIPVFFLLGSPELDAVLQMRPYQDVVEGEDHLPRPAGHALFSAPQYAIGPLGHKGTLLAHGQPVVHQDTQVPFRRAPLQQVIPQPVLVHAIIPPQMQDSTLAFVKPHPVFFCPALQPIQVLLNGSTAFRCVNQSSQLRIISKLAEGGHYPFIKVIDEDVEQDQTQHRPLRNTASYRSPTGLCTTNNDPLCSVSQPVFNPPHCPLIYPTLPQLCYKDVVGDSIKSLAEIKVDYTHCSSHIHPARDNIIEGYQIGQARPPPCEPVLTTPDNLLFFQLSGDDIQYKLFHHLSRDRAFRHLPRPPRPLKDDRKQFSNHLCQLPQHLWMHPIGSYGFVNIGVA
ncbi:uncharacterized protein LOC128071565 isoform X3 [Tympanuchus pallidicinctus]|uniref:uncharacterized protein LOC128071565 isoform X3 n=1 Tax=Tympanuchus pallidicinctus TaxID=109042 RepID=UPI0022875A0B|nr:uncharacterized protein LOC128071565 isoform X3 [Tympanuchus pallidicinctus]